MTESRTVLMERLAREMERVLREPLGEEVVSVEGVRYRIERLPGPGTGVRASVVGDAPPGAPLTMARFEADEWPAEYPPGLPFLPGVRVEVTTSQGNGRRFLMALWHRPGPARRALEALAEASQADGWAVAERRLLPAPLPLGRMGMIRLTRGGDDRVIQGTDLLFFRVVVLLDSLR